MFILVFCFYCFMSYHVFMFYYVLCFYYVLYFYYISVCRINPIQKGAAHRLHPFSITNHMFILFITAFPQITQRAISLQKALRLTLHQLHKLAFTHVCLSGRIYRLQQLFIYQRNQRLQKTLCSSFFTTFFSALFYTFFYAFF